MIEVKLELNLICSQCGAKLYVVDVVYKEVNIKLVPCEYCLDGAYESGMNDGHSEGYDEGYEVAKGDKDED